jgi:hypothetical protein
MSTRKEQEYKRYNELLKQGLKPSEALHIIESERENHEESLLYTKKPQHRDEYGENELPEERAYREAKENIAHKYDRVKAVVGEIKAGIPNIGSKKSLIKTGRFVAGSILLAPGDIRANLRREKIKPVTRKAYIKELKSKRRIGRYKIMRPQPIQLMTNEDAFGMGSIFNNGGDLIGNIRGKKKKIIDPFGLSGLF